MIFIGIISSSVHAGMLYNYILASYSFIIPEKFKPVAIATIPAWWFLWIFKWVESDVWTSYVTYLILVVNTTPSLRDLQQYFTPQYAVQWRMIGIQLGLPSGTLDIIEHHNHYKARECCNAMLRDWLQVDMAASWEKLFTVIESPAVSCSAPDKGN